MHEIESHHLEKPQRAPSRRGTGNLLRNPFYLLLATAITIFIAEMSVMILLPYLPFLTSFQKAILDATSLLLIVFPTLYFFFFRPLRLQIDQRHRAEAEKDALILRLRKTLNEVKTLQGIIPICASCKKIRDDQGYWHQVESYVSTHSNALFSHGICPQCADKLYPEFVETESTEE